MSAKVFHKANGEWGYITRCQMLGRECPEAVFPDRVLYLPTCSHLLIVNKLLFLGPVVDKMHADQDCDFGFARP